jgi:hypothetical protein
MASLTPAEDSDVRGPTVVHLRWDDRLPTVEYQLTAEVDPPADTPALDALQRHGVAALLDEHLEMLAEIEGPDGVEIEPLDHRISVHPTGASITWVLDAPALVFAEDAARQVLGELLERTELLSEWRVRRCEVTASDEDLAAALEGTGDLDAEGDVEIEIDLEDLGAFADLGADGADLDERRERLLDAADTLGAFDMDAFGFDEDDEDDDAVTEEAAVLAAGALMTGLDVLTEELFADVQSLDEAGTAASEQEVLWVLHDLPTRYAGHYTALFAKKFLVTTAILGYRLSQPDWDGPRSIAEALAIRLLKQAAENQLDLAGLTAEVPLSRIFEVFDEYAFGDVDVDALFDETTDTTDDEDEIDELVLVDWFQPLEDSEADADADSDVPVDQTV